MCLSASQIIYSFIMMPSTLPPSYVRFLNKAAAKEPWVWKAVQVRRDTADNGCIHSQGLSQSAELTLPPDRQQPRHVMIRSRPFGTGAALARAG